MRSLKLAVLSLSLLFALSCAALRPAHAAPITSGTGPGGVGFTAAGNLSIWLDADEIPQADNTAVSFWNNQRHGGVDGTQGTGTLQPTLQTGELNGRPVVRFDGSDDILNTSFVMGGTSQASSFIVVRQTNSQHGLPFMTASGPPYFGIHSNNDGVNQSYSAYQPGSTANTRINGITSTTLALGSYGILSGLHDGYAGAAQTAAYALPIGGDGCCGGGRRLNGEIAEVAIYNTRVNTAEQVLVENYLSAKYNLGSTPVGINNTLGANDRYAGDLDTSGDYDAGVFGIGRVDVSNQLLNSGTAGFGIEAASLDDNEWAIAGHNGATGVTNNVWNRVWYVDKSGTLDATLSFDFTDAGLALPPAGASFELLYSPTDPFAFSALALTPTINGDTISFAVPDGLLLDGYYTLAIVTVPEPSAWLMLSLGSLGLVWRARRRRTAIGN